MSQWNEKFSQQIENNLMASATSTPLRGHRDTRRDSKKPVLVGASEDSSCSLGGVGGVGGNGGGGVGGGAAREAEEKEGRRSTSFFLPCLRFLCTQEFGGHFFLPSLIFCSTRRILIYCKLWICL